MPAIESFKSLYLQTRLNGKVLGQATGFVAISSRFGHVLVTNWHVVTGRHPDKPREFPVNGEVPNELVICHNDIAGPGRWVERVEPLYDSGNPMGGSPLWLEHPGMGLRVDCIALPLTKLDGVQVYPYDLTDTGPRIPYRVTEVVSVVGFPFGLRVGGQVAVWATGYVASEPVIDYGDLPRFLVDSRTRKGQSGSPVIAYRPGGMVPMEDGSVAMYNGPICRFLGVYSGRIKEESDLGIVWKQDAVRAVVENGVAPVV